MQHISATLHQGSVGGGAGDSAP